MSLCMSFVFDHDNGKAGRALDRAGDEDASFPSSPDWIALRSRFFAAHEVGALLTGKLPASQRVRTHGSFAGSTASLLHRYGMETGSINLDISTNGKRGGVNVASVAGTDDETGERG
jgi:hypothetical protein